MISSIQCAHGVKLGCPEKLPNTTELPVCHQYIITVFSLILILPAIVVPPHPISRDLQLEPALRLLGLQRRPRMV